MIANHTSIHHLFVKALRQYDMLRKRGAFLDQYKKVGDGMHVGSGSSLTSLLCRRACLQMDLMSSTMLETLFTISLRSTRPVSALTTLNGHQELQRPLRMRRHGTRTVIPGYHSAAE